MNYLDGVFIQQGSPPAGYAYLTGAWVPYPDSAGDIGATLTRVVSEAVGTFLEARATRVSAEAIGTLVGPVASRVALEVIGTSPPLNARLRRMAAEILQEVGYEFGMPASKVSRAVAEVIGLEQEYLGKRAAASRVVLEALGLVPGVGTGLDLPLGTVGALTLGLAFTRNSISEAGSVQLTDYSGNGIVLYWNAGENYGYAYRVVGGRQDGTALMTNLVAGVYTLVLNLPDVGRPFAPLSLNGIAALDGYPKAEVNEVLLWDRQLDMDEQVKLEGYLRWKWIDGRNPAAYTCSAS